MRIFTFTYQDEILLKTIMGNKEIGTLELAKKLKLSPQNTIKRIKKLEKYDMLNKKKIGRGRIFEVTIKGTVALNNISSILQIAANMASKETVDITKKHNVYD